MKQSTSINQDTKFHGCHGFNGLHGCHGFNGLFSKKSPDCASNSDNAGPVIAEFEITSSCSLASRYSPCRFCFATSPKSRKDLSQKERLETIGRLAKIGIQSLVLSGGEPFDIGRDNLLELIESAVSHDIQVFLSTSGLHLTQSYARELKSAGLGSISISLDGSNELIHGNTRDTKTFAPALRGLSIAVENDLTTVISTVLSKANISDIEEMVEFALGVGADELYYIPVIGVGRATEESAFFLSPKEKFQFLKKIKTLNSLYKSKKFVIETSMPQKAIVSGSGLFSSDCQITGCTAGFTDIGVLPDGQLVDCPIHRMGIGHLDDIADDSLFFWKSSELEAIRNRISFSGKCSSCDHIFNCGGCRAESRSSSGSHLGSEKDCYFYEKTGE